MTTGTSTEDALAVRTSEAAPRWAGPAVVAVAVAVRVPYALEGPRYLLDDYYTLWFRMSRGLLGTAGPGQLLARPGAWLAYLVEFGVLGRHPLVGYLVLAGLGTTAAYLLFRCAARLVPWRAALAVSVLWAVTANHSTLDHWLSTVNIVLGLCLLLGGTCALIGATDDGRAPILASVLLVASGLCYEATLAPAAAVVVAIPWLRSRWPRVRVLVGQEVALVGAAVWMVLHTKHDLHAGAFAYRDLPMSLFGTGVVHERAVAAVLMVAAVSILVASVAALIRRRGPALGPRLALAGAALIALGTLAFIRDPISPLDLGDRVNQVAAIGAALVWVGGALQLTGRRWASTAALAGLVAVSTLGHLVSDLDYRHAGTDTAHIFAAVLKKDPVPPGHVVVVGPMYLSHDGVTGLLGPEGQAFDVATRREGWDVWVALAPSDFASVPPADRVTVHG